MSAKRLIGLAGAKGAGKDTVGEIIGHTNGFARIALADPLRAGLQSMFGLEIEVFEDRGLKELPIDWLSTSPRRLMQTLGTEWGRNHIAHDVWLRVAARRIEKEEAPGVVVTDVRFEDEAAWVRSMGGVVWHIQRPSLIQCDAHVSEAGVLIRDGDAVITNSGSIVDLASTVVSMLYRYKA